MAEHHLPPDCPQLKLPVKKLRNVPLIQTSLRFQQSVSNMQGATIKEETTNRHFQNKTCRQTQHGFGFRTKTAGWCQKLIMFGIKLDYF